MCAKARSEAVSSKICNRPFFLFEASTLWSSFSGGSVVKKLPVNAGDMCSISGLGRSPGEGNGNPLQYSCLGNPVDREARRAIVRGVPKSRT